MSTRTNRQAQSYALAPAFVAALLGLATAACDDDDDASGDDDTSASDASTASDTGSNTAESAGTSADAPTGSPDELDEAAILAEASAYATEMQRVSDEARPSQHGLASTVHFYVQPDLAELYLAIDPENPTQTSFPPDALLVKESLDADGNVDGLFAMYKAPAGYDPEGNDWYWLRVDAAGSAADAGRVGFCKDCHAGGSAAVSDLVFGVPLDNRL